MLIKNAHIVNHDFSFVGDVKIVDDKIEKFGQDLEDKEVVDLDGLYLLPGLIDLNVRTYDDKMDKEHLLSLEKEALEGGVTYAALMPDLQPPIDNEVILELFDNGIVVPFIRACKEKGLSEISILLKKGGQGIVTDSDVNSYLLARIFEYAKMHQKMLHVRPHNRSLREVGVMHDGEVAFHLGLGGIDPLEETSEVAKVIEYAKRYQVGVVFKGLSTQRALDLVARCRCSYSEVSIHHLLFNDEACLGFNTYAKIMPPLRNEEERKALVDSLRSGKINILTSLHSPKSIVNKEVSFDEAAEGIDAIGYYLPLLYTKLVKSAIIDFQKVVELSSTNPAAVLDLKKGKVEEGYDADFVIFDPNGVTKTPSNTPYGGEMLHGAVKGVIKGGQLLWIE